ncbi:DUF4190 domain-containing protein [Agromyces sp. CFH 90414]|uniref:DUF4190 domain-containing protein n=1 Tax=Agromyces agglutinans TaxID=2662258 RepID=A0A6I2FBT9_9MICO|nr:DUF4190 domain-containing protein [Agromyces agglutinans]MRG61277.1 DUF4190 domain-containing protein [Agromyces agglutinans]
MTDPNAPEQPDRGAAQTPGAAETPSAPPVSEPAAPAYGSAAPAAPAYGAPGYGAPGYGAPAYGAAAPAKTNTLAIVSLIASIAGIVIVYFIGSVVGVICGHIAINQIKKTGEQGRGMAIAGLIVGYVGIVLSIIGVILLIAFSAWLFATYPTTPTY